MSAGSSELQRRSTSARARASSASLSIKIMVASIYTVSASVWTSSTIGAWRSRLSGQDGSFHSLRQRDRAKRLFRIQVILAGLIDYPKQAVFLGSSITKRDINFTLFE